MYCMYIYTPSLPPSSPPSLAQVLEEFGVKYVLNVTTKCPNYYEEEKDFVYKRIAVIDTGTQKLSQHFMEAFEFIGEKGEEEGGGGL